MSAIAHPEKPCTTQLVPHLTPGAIPPPGYVAVVANDGVTRFPVKISTFRQYSVFAEGVLSEEAVQNDVPLESDRADVESVRIFCSWLARRETVAAADIEVPTPKC